MARKLREVSRLEKVPVRRVLPMARREIHSPIATLSTGAARMRLRPEATYKDTSQADFACRVLENLGEFIPPGSPPISERVLRMLPK